MAQTAAPQAQSPTKVVTGLVRFSYANLTQPRANEDGKEPKYSTAILIPKSDKQTLNRIQKAIDAAITIGKEKKWGGKVPAKLTKPMRDGDEEKPDDPAYAGQMYLNCSSKQRPNIVGPDRKPILTEEEIYSGMYGHISLNFFPYDTKNNKGVGVGLNNVMKVKDGEKFGGGSSAEEDFADIQVDGWKPVGEDDDDLLD